MKIQHIIFLSFLILLNCKGDDMQNELNKLLQTDEDFAKTALEIGTANAFRDYAAEDAIMLPNGGKVIDGKAAIFEAMKSDNDSKLEWFPVKGEIGKSADLGYTWGKWTYTYSDSNGEEKKQFGKYVSIWRKNKNGDWKWIVDIGNNSPE